MACGEEKRAGRAAKRRFRRTALGLAILTVLAEPTFATELSCERSAAIVGMTAYDRVLAGEAAALRRFYEPLRPLTSTEPERYGGDSVARSRRDLERALDRGDRAEILSASQAYLGALLEHQRTGGRDHFPSGSALTLEIARIRATQERLFPETQGFRSWLWARLRGLRPRSDANALEELQRIETAMRALNPRTHAFRELGRRKLALLEAQFDDVVGMRQYLSDFRELFHLLETGRSLFKPIEPRSETQRQLLRQFGEASSIHRLPGTVAMNLQSARETLRALSPAPALVTREERPYLPRGQTRLFLAAETLALARRADPRLSLSAAERQLAEAYENTVAELRSTEVEIRAPDGADRRDARRLSFIISAVSDAASTERDGAYLLGISDGSFDHEFVRDRFRYALTSEPGMTVEQALELSADVRRGQSEAHLTDMWWFGEARVTRDTRALYDGSTLLRRGDIANYRWMRMFPRRGYSSEGNDGPVPHHVLTDENVLSGPLTAQAINGHGLHVDGSSILRRRAGSRVSRPFDPAQREVMRDGEVPTRTVGWQQVAEVPLGESGNPELRGVIRRVFWSEAPVDGSNVTAAMRPGSGVNIHDGEFRIAQQSVPLSEVIQRLPENDRLRRDVEAHLALAVRRPMPAALARRVQDAFNTLGEVDAVRGELIVGIEAILEGRAVPRAMQWTWNAERREWAFEERVVRPGEDRTGPNRRRGEPVLLNCQTCHAVRLNPMTFRGRCVVSQRSDDLFSGEANNALRRERRKTGTERRETTPYRGY